MFAQWINNHLDEILDTYVEKVKARGDTRPAEVIRTPVALAVTTLARSLRGELDWEAASAAAARQLLWVGSTRDSLINGSEALYAAISQLLSKYKPPEHLEWLETIGQQTLVFSRIVIKVLEETLIERNGQLETLCDLNKQINTVTSEEGLLGLLTQSAKDAGASEASLLEVEVDESGKPTWCQVVATWHKTGNPSMPVDTRHSMGDYPLSALLLADPETASIIANVATDDRVDEATRKTLARESVGARILVPLTHGGRWLGLCVISWPEPQSFSPQDMAIYNTLPAIASPAAALRRLAR